MLKRLGLLVVVSLLLPRAAAPVSAGPQTSSASTQDAASAAARLKVQVAAAVAASKAAIVAEKAAQSGEQLQAEVETLKTLLTDAAAAVAAMVEKAQAVSRLATKVAADATEAAGAATAAAGVTTSDLAKLRAVRAAERASSSASAASESANTIVKTLAAITNTTEAPAARKLVETVVERAGKIVGTVQQIVYDTTEAGAQAASPDLPITTDADEDVLAALRIRLVGGAILSNGGYDLTTTVVNGVTTASLKSNQFSESTAYLAVESQPRLASFDWKDCSDREAPLNQAPCQPTQRRGYHRYYFDGLLNARLTSIAVSKAGPVSAPGTEFLASEKAAHTQIGLLLGRNFGGFEAGNSRFHWGLAGTFQVGFQSVTDSNRSVRVWNLADDVYESYAGGARLTLFQNSGRVRDTVRHGWSPTAYLDVTIGNFQNFHTATPDLTKETGEAAKQCLSNPASCLAGTVLGRDAYVITRKPRASIVSRLMLAFAYLGMDLNLGSGRDDMRFIGGVTVTLDQVMRRQ